MNVNELLGYQETEKQQEKKEQHLRYLAWKWGYKASKSRKDGSWRLYDEWGKPDPIEDRTIGPMGRDEAIFWLEDQDPRTWGGQYSY